MKVLVFTSQFHQLGGAERLGVELAEELNKRGIHTDVLSMYTKDLPGVAEATQNLLRRGIPAVHFLGMRVHPPLPSMIPAILKLRRLIREQGYDVIETSTVSPTVLMSWAGLGLRARHVAGLHQVFKGDRENRWPHKFWRFSARCNRRIRYYAVSNNAAEQWTQYSGVERRYVRTIYNAIADECFAAASDRSKIRAELGIPADARLAIYVGRLAAYKGIDTLLDALGPILAEHRLFLLYVGCPDKDIPGTGEMLRRLKDRIAKEHWEDRVQFLGFRKDVPRLMASSDLLVHPTRIEGFGLVLAEAMAAGLPVVASDVEGIPEVVAGTESLMVRPDDPTALRQAVLEALNRTPSEASLAIEKARLRASEFRMERRADAMIRLFEDVLCGWF
ncbi:MAG: glycosyltransferase family 4 protein [Sedimentisphaerales bacterium]|nr:glycosyltransferase family 4 protein [Sedimentisphaerales bacterium]